MMIGHFNVSIIAHYHASNMAAVLSDCTRREAQTSSLSHSDIYNPWLHCRVDSREGTEAVT